MKLRRFVARNLNHIENLTIDFYDDLNFIVGVNGSGKTSIITSIISLLTPNFESLAALRFDEIRVDYEFNDRNLYVSATQEDDIVTIKTSKDTKGVRFLKIDSDGIFGSRDQDERSKYFNNQLNIALENKRLHDLFSLPTPMFLGLDRRFRGGAVGDERLLFRGLRRRKKNPFGSSLGDSLNQAAGLVEARYRVAENKVASLRAEFVRDLLLELIEFPVGERVRHLETPTNADRKLVDQSRRALLQFPKVEGISADDVRSRIEPTLAHISNVLNAIPVDMKMDQLRKATDVDHNLVSNIVEWSSFKPSLNKINRISELIETYNRRTKDARRDITKYTNLVDDFIGETGKSIGFDAEGLISIRYNKGIFGVEELSSGEAQIFVLLSHLAFNSSAQDTGLFIIDEPELSLHLLWQEKLVDSLLKANSSIQYVFATHSPAIIMEKMGRIINITTHG